ncbi:MAG: SUMF1/EgtB/PvdO family nonheme iron enzyme [Bacteroidales bacterium]|nr:SUMF1/EgtB/PvdO family nonheme iron enzyme [Bacteroidales bacterium]MBN2817544.1 SUMF1/EgtB/PvdO family nonheme iron enzyme [Bacteroidales bacterium]
MAFMSSCVKDYSEDFVLVKGDSFFNNYSKIYKKSAAISDFYMSKYEITQTEWMKIMESNPSAFKGDNQPVEMVSWYDCIEYCNKRSIKEGFKPYYTIDKKNKDTNNKSELDSIKWTITINKGANGYRLPTEAEWQYAASGGKHSRDYIYCGSNDLDEAGWYWRNSGDSALTGSWLWIDIENNNSTPKPVGLKKPNELGLYDMSGNVREWCENWYADVEIDSGYYRCWRGGGWIGGEHACIPSYRGKFEANGKGPDQGFRVCRSKL